jgi:NUMOD3 motif
VARYRSTSKEERFARKRYVTDRYDAIRGGKGFELTFEEWFRIWTNSGHFNERGCRKGQYVMARTKDLGPYALGNVRICTVEENRAEQAANLRPETRAKISRSLLNNKYAVGNKNHLGHKQPQSAKDAISKANRNRVLSDLTKARMSRAKKNNTYRLGTSQSPGTRAKMRASQTARRERERALREKENDPPLSR